jgi:hypothetical protein
MEGLFPLSGMAEGGRVLGEEGNALPSTSSMITGMEMLQWAGIRDEDFSDRSLGDNQEAGRKGTIIRETVALKSIFMVYVYEFTIFCPAHCFRAAQRHICPFFLGKCSRSSSRDRD